MKFPRTDQTSVNRKQLETKVKKIEIPRTSLHDFMSLQAYKQSGCFA